MANDVLKIKKGDRVMDHWAVEKLIDWAAGTKSNETTKTTLTDDIVNLAAELAGSTPSPLERVLAHTAATCWFAFRMHEGQYAGNVVAEGMSLAQSEHAQRRMDRAHRRFLSTVKTLATVSPARPSRGSNQRRPPAGQSTQRRGTIMKRGDARSMMPILRAYLASDSPDVRERLARRIAEFILEKSMDGHFGYFKLVLDLVDGKLHRTAEDEMTFGPIATSRSKFELRPEHA